MIDDLLNQDFIQSVANSSGDSVEHTREVAQLLTDILTNIRECGRRMAKQGGKFITYLTMYLKNTFAEVAWVRTATKGHECPGMVCYSSGRKTSGMWQSVRNGHRLKNGYLLGMNTNTKLAQRQHKKRLKKSLSLNKTGSYL